MRFINFAFGQAAPKISTHADLVNGTRPKYLELLNISLRDLVNSSIHLISQCQSLFCGLKGGGGGEAPASEAQCFEQDFPAESVRKERRLRAYISLKLYSFHSICLLLTGQLISERLFGTQSRSLKFPTVTHISPYHTSSPQRMNSWY